MPISAQQEKTLSEANQRYKKKQDKVNPHVININDGRLMPNVSTLREHVNYRVYTGPKDATTEERMKWLQGALKQMPDRHVTGVVEDFDVSTADKDALITFAMEEWGLMLSPELGLSVLRRQVLLRSQQDVRLIGGKPTPPTDVDDLG